MTNPKLFQNTNKRYQLRNSELQARNVKEKEAVLQRFFSNFRNCGCTLQSCNFITRELYYIYFFSKFSLQLFHNTVMKIFVTESSRVLGSSLYCVYALYVVCLTFFEEIRPVSEWVSECLTEKVTPLETTSWYFWRWDCLSITLREEFPYSELFLYMERYSISIRIHSECRKIRARKIPNTDTFHVV